MKCTAKVKLDRNHVIVYVNETHNHERPSNIVKTKDGRYYVL